MLNTLEQEDSLQGALEAAKQIGLDQRTAEDILIPPQAVPEYIKLTGKAPKRGRFELPIVRRDNTPPQQVQ